MRRCAARHGVVRAGIAAASMVATCAGAAAQSVPVRTEAARGVAGAVEVEYSGGVLRAKPVRDANAPMLVRVTGLPRGRHRIEFMGLVGGVYDLSEFVELESGRPAEGLSALPVWIVSQLPPVHGTDVFGLTPPGFGFSAHYRVLLGIGAGLWAAAPLVVLTRRMLRRRAPVVVVPPPPEPTPVELLTAAVKAASERELTVAERGRLELLLLRVLLDRSGEPDRIGSPGELARAVAAVRGNPRTSGVVVAVERWLHERGGRDGADALAVLEDYRRTALEPASCAGAAGAASGEGA